MTHREAAVGTETQRNQPKFTPSPHKTQKDKKTNKGAIFVEKKVVILALNRCVVFPHTKPYIFAFR